MKRISYYILYPIIIGVSLLPFFILYRISDLLSLFMKILGYRKSVINENLKNSFPSKSQKELNSIRNSFYENFADLIVETIKLFSISTKELEKRCQFEDLSLLDQLHEEKHNIIMVLGHYGNWEWAGPVMSLKSKFKQGIVYHPLGNQYFDEMLLKMRAKHGSIMIPMQSAFKQILLLSKKEQVAITLVSDQSPNPNTAYWTEFLNQETPVFQGVEKIGNKLNMKIVFTTIEKVRRGHYQIKTRLLNTDKTEGSITQAHTRALEEDIIKNPSLWLWSHRRWKHKRSKA